MADTRLRRYRDRGPPLLPTARIIPHRATVACPHYARGHLYSPRPILQRMRGTRVNYCHVTRRRLPPDYVYTVLIMV